MELQEIAQKIADELKKPSHGYKNEKVRFTAMCRRWYSSHGFLLNISRDVFTEKIKNILDGKSPVADENKPIPFIRKARRMLIDEGSGLIFTLKQVAEFNLNPESYE